MISRLEAALSVATGVVIVCSLAGWRAGSTVVDAVFLALAAAFVIRIACRRSRGLSWQQAWGRERQ
jgi:hypothetical protein